MFDTNFENRRELVKKNVDLNNGYNKKDYIHGNNNKVELDKKLEEISINSGVMISGNLARKGVLSQAVQPNRSVTSVYDVSISEEESNNYSNEYYERQLASGINRGKDILNSIKNSKKND